MSTIEVIDLSYLSHVRGGLDKQTTALQAEIDRATGAMTDVAKAVGPKADGSAMMFELLPQLMAKRGSRSGPTPAPALPPTSTLTR